MVKIIEKREEEGNIPDFARKYVGVKAKNFPTIRSIAMAKPGWCMPEADLQTAEMRGLAFISGDRNMLHSILDPDPNWAYVDPRYVPADIEPSECMVRLGFPDYIPDTEHNRQYIMVYATNGIIHARFTEDQLLRDELGQIVHTKVDTHWTNAERSRNACREDLDKKKDRGAAKAVGFSMSYGGQAPSIKRGVYATTGIDKPIEEIEAMMEAVDNSRPRATEWMHELEQTPKTTGKLVAASGRIRHCHTFGDIGSELSKRTKESMMTALGRECRNFFLQESVAAVAARALYGSLKFRDRFNLQGYVCVCLYDSLVVHCPYEERHLWEKALELFMHLSNGWAYGHNLLRYAIDMEYNAGWSTHYTDHEMNEHMKDRSWHPVPEDLKHVDEWLDNAIRIYTEHPEISVYNKKDLRFPLERVG